MIGSMSNMTGNILYHQSKRDITSMPKLKKKDWPLIIEISPSTPNTFATYLNKLSTIGPYNLILVNFVSNISDSESHNIEEYSKLLQFLRENSIIFFQHYKFIIDIN